MKCSMFVMAVLLLSAATVSADDRTRAAVGGGVGGAVGAAVGEELGDRDGAIIGGAIGGALGAAIATDDDDRHHQQSSTAPVQVEVHASGVGHPGRHCPPGQAKKGRC